MAIVPRWNHNYGIQRRVKDGAAEQKNTRIQEIGCGKS